MIRGKNDELVDVICSGTAQVPFAFDTHIINAFARIVKHFVEKNSKFFFCEFVANVKKFYQKDADFL